MAKHTLAIWITADAREAEKAFRESRKAAEDSASGTERAARRSADAIEAATKRGQLAMEGLKAGFTGMERGGRAIAAAGIGLTAWPIALAARTIPMEESLNSLKQIGVKDLEAMKSMAVSFSNQWAGQSAPQVVAAAYDIQSALNLNEESLRHLTEVNALTGIATKATADEMKGAFTTGWGIMRQTMPNKTDVQFLDSYSAALTRTVQRYRATGGSMAEAISVLGAGASTLGFSLESQLAVLGKLQTTMAPERAGTYFNSFLTGSKANLKKLGPEFRKAFDNKDIVGMLEAVKKRVGDLGTVRAQAKLGKIFGREEAVKFIVAMNNTKDLAAGIDDVTNSSKQGMKYVKATADIVNHGLGAQSKIAQQRLDNLASQIGDTTAPAVLELTDTLSDGLLVLQDWAKQNEEVVEGFGKTSLAVGPMLVGAGGLVWGLGAVGNTVVSTMEGIKKLGGLIRGLPAVPVGGAGAAGSAAGSAAGAAAGSAGGAAVGGAATGASLITPVLAAATTPLILGALAVGTLQGSAKLHKEAEKEREKWRADIKSKSMGLTTVTRSDFEKFQAKYGKGGTSTDTLSGGRNTVGLGPEASLGVPVPTKPGAVKGQINIKFEGMPAGMNVQSVTTTPNLDLGTDTGRQ